METVAHHPLRLSEFIEQRQAEILAEWERRVRNNPIAQGLHERALRDHIPEIVLSIAKIVRSVHTGEQATLGDLPDLHALQRLDAGFDLRAAASELATLRDVILEAWEREAAHAVTVAEIQQLSHAVDETLARSVDRFATARERTLRALDQVSSAALGTGDLDTFLPKLLSVVLESTEAVDSASVYLSERDGRLRVRAAVGLEEEVANGFTLRVGEGFIGRIALTREPLLVRNAATDPLVLSKVIRERGVRALYGVPLLHDGNLIGVASMGSGSTFDFSEEDKQLFRAMAQRTTSIIVQAQILEQLRTSIAARERIEEELRSTATFREQFLGMVGHDLRSPLNAIRMTGSILLRDAGGDAQRERHALRILTGSDRIARMLDDLNDFVRGRLGDGIPVKTEPADLRDLACSAVDEHRAAYPDRQIEFRADGMTDGHWDPGRVAQVVSNLLSNALRHGDAEAPVQVTVRGGEHEVVLEVHNSGHAIPDDVRPTLFEPFRQGRTRTDGEGLGLGLFIVDQIVRAHHGRIDVRSTQEEGTTFSVTWPR